MRYDICTQSIRAFPAASFPSMKILSTGILLLMLLFFPSRSTAHQVSVSECKEASDFIKNAALARDNGVVETIFIDRIRDEIEIIRAFPPHLRWFVKDESDAKLLLTAAVNVFKHPKTARDHQIDFFNACVESVKATSSTRKIRM